MAFTLPLSVPIEGAYIVPAPTGVAATDRQNIQDAIDQAAYGGGTVFLQRGTYILEPAGNYSCCLFLYQGVRLVGSGMLATILNAADSDCHVIMSNPAQWGGNNYLPANGISIKDLQVLAGPNSGSFTGIYLKGVVQCLIENVLVNGNYFSAGYHFNRGMHLKAWVGTVINCSVVESYQGYNLSWDDDLDGNPSDNTNALEMVGCHYEGGTLPPPEAGSLIGCYINGFANHLTGCTIERRLTETLPLNTVGILVKERGGNTFTGCYFEGWKVTFKFDGCSGTNVTGGFMLTCFGIDAIQYLNGAELVSSGNNVQNVCQGFVKYSENNWNFLGVIPRNDLGRISIAPHGTIPDNGHSGNLNITKTALSGQYINLIRSANFVWTLGMTFNTNNFAIGPGQEIDSNFTKPFFTLQPDGKMGVGTTTPETQLHLGGTDAIITIANTNNNPPIPAPDKARLYIKDDKLVVQYKDGTTTRYKWLPLTGSGVNWQQGTTAP
jgi:hypothetical protein